MLVAARHRHAALILWSLPRTIPIAALAVLAVLLDQQLDLHLSALAMPTSALGTAIALFLGFKNNQAYERFWEGRKIWGSIVNTSRCFAVSVKDFVRASPDEEAARVHRELVLRHLAWINALRMALRREKAWDTLSPYLDASELEELKSVANKPHRLLRAQSERIEALVDAGQVQGLARHLELRTLLRQMWDEQGGCERLANTPLVPHYTTAATVFVWVFIAMFPFSILDVLEGTGVWVVVPVATLIGWVYDSTNRLGQLTADPFDGSPTDVPMTALCRTIEIDLRPLIGDPPPPSLKPDGLVLD